ncbi:nucleolar protein dao-5-like [Pecten maximus]|uniref:nucleolar protein dao-5-like n=1 Tax=Pecten maximus TaxID=6579 RepID=UPI0014587D6F|nr:nucleolar protein dao-5-like [Pecten maximus]XP_033727901.1 nucleolar protein dao-5-like [Pecten maximus]
MSRYGRTYDSSYTPRSYDSSARSYDVGSRSHDLGASSRYDTSSSTGSYGSDMSHQYATDYSLESGRGYDSGRGLDSGRSYDTSGLSSYDSRGYISPRTGSSDLGYSSSSRYGRSDYTDRSTDVTLRDKPKEEDLDSHGVRRRYHGSKFKDDDEPLGYKHGVNKDDDIALYKASYRRYRDSYGDEDKSDSEKGSLASSRRESEERDPIAEIKRKYQRKKQDTINENEAALSLSKTDTDEISRCALSDRLGQHLSSPRGGVQRSQSEREAKADHPVMEQTGSVDAEADTMPVWRKRRLEREQRRREFLNMSENKSKERERLKSEANENKEKDNVSSIQSESRIGDKSESRISDKSESRTETARDRLQRLKDAKLPPKSSSVDSVEEGNSLEDGTRAFSAEAMKKILLQRDSPLLRTKYAEAKRKKELEKESSREETPIPSTDVKVDKRESVISPLSFKADRLWDSDSPRTRFGSAENQDLHLSSLERKYSGRELKDSPAGHDRISSRLGSDSDSKSRLGSDSKPMTLEQRIAARIGSDSSRFSSRVGRDEEVSDSKTISPLNRSQSARAPGGHDLGTDKISSQSDPKLSTSLSRSYSSRDEKDGSRLGMVLEKKYPLREPSDSSLIARSLSDTRSGSSSSSVDMRHASTSSVRTASTSSDTSSVFVDKYPSKPSVSSTDQKASLERKWSSREEKEHESTRLDPKSSFTSSQLSDQQKSSSAMSRKDLEQKKMEDKGKESNDIRSRYMDTLKTSEITSKRVEKALEQDKRLEKEHVIAKKESSSEIQRPVPAERHSKRLSSSSTSSDIRQEQVKTPSVSSTGVLPGEGEKRKSTEIKRHKGLKERLEEKDKIRMKMLESVKQKQEQKSKMEDKPADVDVKVTAKVMSVDISASNSKSKQGINVAQKSVSTNVSQSGRDIKPSQETVTVRTDIAYNQDVNNGTKRQDRRSSDNLQTKSTPKLDPKATSKVATNVTTKIDSKTTPASKLDTKTTPASKLDTKTTPASKLDTKTTLASKLDTKTTPASKLDTKTTPASKLDTKTTPASKLDTKTTPASKLDTKTTPASKLDTKTTPASKLDTKTTPASKLYTKSTAASKLDTKTTPASKLDTKSTSKVDMKAQQDIDPTSKSDTKEDEGLKSLEEARCVKPSDLKSRKIKHYVRSKSNHVQEDVKNEKPENEEEKTKETSESSIRTQRPYGQVKAKTTDVASLLSKGEEEDSASSNGISQEGENQSNMELSRMERIALYKDERRRQLAFIAAKFGDSDKESEDVKMSEIAPSLFTTAASRANGSNEDISTLARSRSLRENSPQKSVTSIISRSSSLRDSSPRLTASPERDTQGGNVNLASKFSKFRERFNEGNIPTTTEEDVQRKDGYPEKELSSLEIRRQRLLYGESQFDSGKLLSIKPEEKLERQDSTEDDKPQKKRRQLPNIPAALGGTPEPQLFDKDGEEDVDSQSQSSSSSGPSPPTVKNVPFDASKTKSETVAIKPTASQKTETVASKQKLTSEGG